MSKAKIQAQIGLSLLKFIMPPRYLGISHCKPFPTSKFYTFPLCHLPLPIHNTVYPTATVKFFPLHPPGLLLPDLHISCLFHMEFSSLSSQPGGQLILQLMAWASIPPR